MIRIIDGTTVPKAGPQARKDSQLWRIHSAFDLPQERFGWFELTDQQDGERLDRIPVIKGEIRLGDQAYMQPDRIAAVLDGGGDVVVRSGWKSVAWLEERGLAPGRWNVLRPDRAVPSVGAERAYRSADPRRM